MIELIASRIILFFSSEGFNASIPESSNLVFISFNNFSAISPKALSLTAPILAL
jgi:hypothetical protein